MNILGTVRTPEGAARAWALARGAVDEFVGLATTYWRLAPLVGVRPEVAYGQAAKETGFGHFGGTIDATYHNPCGLKTAAGGDNGDPEAHQRFPAWEVGIQAHLDHLALYAGMLGYPRVQTFDPRHFSTLCGSAPRVEDLSNRWAGPGYGESLRDDYVKPLLAFEWTPPVPPEYVTKAVAYGIAANVSGELKTIIDAELEAISERLTAAGTALLASSRPCASGTASRD